MRKPILGVDLFYCAYFTKIHERDKRGIYRHSNLQISSIFRIKFTCLLAFNPNPIITTWEQLKIPCTWNYTDKKINKKILKCKS